MPEKDSFMVSRLSLGTRIRCQSLCLRHPLRASEIDSLRGQAVTARSCQESKGVCCSYLHIRQKQLFVCYLSNK
jgi:hypothetical protein